MCFGQSLLRVQKFCELGGQPVKTQGLNSTNKFQQSFPQCTVAVYQSGTTTLASIFSNNLATPTPLANPFTANVDGSFGFYAAPGACYDVVTSGAGFPNPFTYSYICLNSGGGAAGSPCPASVVNGAIGASNGAGGFLCDNNFTTDFFGNWTSQSGRTVGPVNGMLGIVGGGTSPGTLAKFKLGGHEFRWLGGGVITPYYAVPPLTLPTNGQIIGAISQSTDGNGDPVVQLGWQNNTGGVTYPNAANPSTPVVTNGGTPGSTTYSYQVVCTQDGLAASNYHSAPSATGTTTTGNATLSNTNYNLLTGYDDTLYGYRGCNVYRTAGGATQGLIATNVGKAFRDTGLAGNGATPPSTNTSILDPTGPSRGQNQCNSIFHSPEGVDAPPCTPTSVDDEFSHTFGTPADVNDGSLQWGTQNTATAAWTNGALAITPDTSANVEFVKQVAALPTAPYTFVTYVDLATFPAAPTGTACGIGLLESGTNKIGSIEFLNIQNLSTATGSGGFAVIVRNTTVGGGAGSAITYLPYSVNQGYLKIQVTGGNIIYSFSPSGDGVSYVVAKSQALTVPFTTAPDTLILDAIGTGGTATCNFDYKRRTQ